jgi:hypothetical protein
MGLARNLSKKSATVMIVQFERFGFCIRDSGENLEFIYCHD